MLKENLIKLVQEISVLGSDDMNMFKLEAITSLIIGSDEFDDLPDNVQSAVYFIDMHEIEHPTLKQILESGLIIKNFLEG